MKTRPLFWLIMLAVAFLGWSSASLSAGYYSAYDFPQDQSDMAAENLLSVAVAPVPVPPKLELVGWAVVGVHGSARAISVPLTEGYVESRGVSQMRIRITFNSALDSETLAGDVLTINGQLNGDVTPLVAGLWLEDAGRSVVLELMAPLPDCDRYTLTLSGAVRDVQGQALQSQAVAEMAVLIGDADGSGTVTAADLAMIRAAVGSELTSDTARYDIDGSGEITVNDLAVARRRLGQALP